MLRGTRWLSCQSGWNSLFSLALTEKTTGGSTIKNQGFQQPKVDNSWKEKKTGGVYPRSDYTCQWKNIFFEWQNRGRSSRGCLVSGSPERGAGWTLPQLESELWSFRRSRGAFQFAAVDQFLDLTPFNFGIFWGLYDLPCRSLQLSNTCIHPGHPLPVTKAQRWWTDVAIMVQQWYTFLMWW